MSTGLFMGIRGSYTEESRGLADKLLKEINDVLAANGFATYVDPDPPPNVYTGHLFGRSALDHHSSRVLRDIADRAATRSKNSPNLALIRDNPYRVVFVPPKLRRPCETKYQERIAGSVVTIWMGSLDGLLEELAQLADDLDIPVEDGQISDRTAIAINDYQPFRDGDSVELVEDWRTAWLALYEGARLAKETSVALTLAG
jgi:hypothetical protein